MNRAHDPAPRRARPEAPGAVGAGGEGRWDRSAPRRWPAVAFAVLVGAGLAEARELIRFGDASLEFRGSARTIDQWTRRTDAVAFTNAILESPPATAASCIRASTFANCPAFDVARGTDVAESLNRLRLRLEARVTPQLTAYLAYDNEMLGGIDSLEGDLPVPSTFLGAEHDIHTFEHGTYQWTWRHVLYRGYLDYRHEKFQVAAGRQRIAWGVGRLWNPIDRFNAVPPLSLERDQSPGVDAIDARWMLSGFTYLEAVYAAAATSDDARYALRLHGIWLDTDYSLVGGVFEDARTVGFDLDRNLEEAAVRFEVVFTDPERDVWPISAPRPHELEEYWQVVASVDRSFAIGTGLYVLVEHLYNGNALGFGEGKAGIVAPFVEATNVPPAAVPAAVAGAIRGPFVRPASNSIFGGSRVVTLTDNTTGSLVSYDATTAIRTNLLVLYDWRGGSAAFFPFVDYRGWDWADVVLGAQVFAGPSHSQFGSVEPLVYVQANVYF